MRIMTLLFASCTLLFLGGCTVAETIEPLSTSKQAHKDKGLYGLWHSREGRTHQYIHILPGKHNSLTVLMFRVKPDQSGKTETLWARTTKIGKRTFVTFRDVDGEKFKSNYFFALYKRKKKRLTLHLARAAYFAKEIEKKRLQGIVKRNKEKKLKRVILTGTTQQLRQYFRKISPKAFDKKGASLRRITQHPPRKPQP